MYSIRDFNTKWCVGIGIWIALEVKKICFLSLGHLAFNKDNWVTKIEIPTTSIEIQLLTNLNNSNCFFIELK